MVRKVCVFLLIIIIMGSIASCGRKIAGSAGGSMVQDQPGTDMETDETDTKGGSAADSKEGAEDEEKSPGRMEVSIERTDKSRRNGDGEVIAIIYYDKPVVSGDSEAAQKINAFFDEEEKNWFEGGGRLTHSIEGYDSFLEGVEMIWEERGLISAKYPLRYAVDTRIEYSNDHLLSIFQIAHCRVRYNNFYFFGSTFDLDTGELLPITELEDINADDMRKIMIDGAQYENAYYGQLGSGNYEITYHDKKVDMRYEYYYDGEAFYLIDNIYHDYRNSVLIKWNGKLNEECEVSLHRYTFGRTNLLWEVN